MRIFIRRKLRCIPRDKKQLLLKTFGTILINHIFERPLEVESNDTVLQTFLFVDEKYAKLLFERGRRGRFKRERKKKYENMKENEIEQLEIDEI